MEERLQKTLIRAGLDAHRAGYGTATDGGDVAHVGHHRADAGMAGAGCAQPRCKSSRST